MNRVLDLLACISLALLFGAILLPGEEAGFMDNGGVRIYLEHGKRQEGVTPVILKTECLILEYFMDGKGNVYPAYQQCLDGRGELFRLDTSQGRILFSRGDSLALRLIDPDMRRSCWRISGSGSDTDIFVDLQRRAARVSLFAGRVKGIATGLEIIENRDGNPVVSIQGRGISSPCPLRLNLQTRRIGPASDRLGGRQ